MSNAIRHPRRNALICVGLAVAGALSLTWGVWRMTSLGHETTATALSIAVGGLVGFFAGLMAVNFFWAERVMARMKAGEGVIARWTVPPALFDRFRQADHDLRPTEGPGDYRPPRVTPPEGVEVVVSSDAVMIGDVWFGLTKVGIARFEGVTYRPGEAPMLVFDTVITLVSSGTSFSTRNMRGVLRVPVAAHAPDQVEAALTHYRAVLDGRVRSKPGFYRRRIKLGLISAGLGLIVFIAGFGLRGAPGLPAELPVGLSVGGAIVGLAGLILAAIAWLLDQKEGRRS